VGVKSVTTRSRQFDGRAVAAGTLVTAVGIAVAYTLTFSLQATLVGPVLGGLVTGWFSRSFENEATDAAVATMIGPFLAPFAYTALFWLQAAGAATTTRLDLGIQIVALGLGLALVAGLLTIPVGLVAGLLAARVRRRLTVARGPVGT
jgi:hypothetical protein